MLPESRDALVVLPRRILAARSRRLPLPLAAAALAAAHAATALATARGVGHECERQVSDLVRGRGRG